MNKPTWGELTHEEEAAIMNATYVSCDVAGATVTVDWNKLYALVADMISKARNEVLDAAIQEIRKRMCILGQADTPQEALHYLAMSHADKPYGQAIGLDMAAKYLQSLSEENQL